MRSIHIKQAAALLLAAALLFSLCLPVFADSDLSGEGSFFAVGYTVSKGRLTRGAAADISVTVKNVSLTADTFRASNYDFSKLIDSFTGGTVTVEKKSSGSDPLVLQIRFSKLKYTGTGQSLRFQITHRDSGAPQLIELTIAEASEGEEKQKPDRDPSPAAEPMVLISCAEQKEPLAPGQEAELTVLFRNLSDLELRSPVATLTPSDSLSIPGGSYSFAMETIKGKQTGSLKVRVRAAQSVSSPGQSLQAELKFTYFNNVSDAQASVSERVPVAASVSGSAAPPVVLASRSELKAPLSAGQLAEIAVTFRNMGSVKLLSPLASFSASESLLLESSAGSVLLPDLEPGKSASVTLRVRALPEISSASQSIQTELKYSYDAAGTMTQGEASDRIPIPAAPTRESGSGSETAEAPVPHVVVSDFSYGGESVDAGSSFDLRFRFENTGKLPIENVLLTVDGGESFTISGGTSSFFFASLAAGAGQEQTLPLQALPNAKSGAQSVSLSFKFEYVDGAKRASAGEDIRLSMPIVQPDRFEIRAPQQPESLSVGEEAVLTLPYVNKGKGEIANVEATVEGEGVETPSKTQYVGNIGAGASGSIGFVFTPQLAGSLPLVVKITYEDANENLQTKEFPVELFAEDPSIDAMLDEEFSQEEPEEAGFPWAPVLGGTGAAAALGGAVLLAVRRRKARREKPQDDWGGWEEPADEADAPAASAEAAGTGEPPARRTGSRTETEE